MSGLSFLIVGGTGSGKTTFIKNRLKKANKNSIFLYDVNNEYEEIIGSQKLPKFDDFTEQATRIKQGVIVFEEATIFLSNTGSNAMVRDILVRKRHTKNTIFLVFHSLRAVPINIYNLSTHVVLFKTNDPIDLVDKRFDNPDFTDMFTRIKEAAWLESKNGKKYSPFEIFSIYGQ